MPFWVPKTSTRLAFPVVCWSSVLIVWCPREVSLSPCEYTYALCVYCEVFRVPEVLGRLCCDRLVVFLNGEWSGTFMLSEPTPGKPHCNWRPFCPPTPTNIVSSMAWSPECRIFPTKTSPVSGPAKILGNWCPACLHAHHSQLPGVYICGRREGPSFCYSMRCIRFESRSYSTDLSLSFPTRALLSVTYIRVCAFRLSRASYSLFGHFAAILISDRSLWSTRVKRLHVPNCLDSRFDRCRVVNKGRGRKPKFRGGLKTNIIIQ